MQSSALVFFFPTSVILGEWVTFSLEVARTESVALQIKRINPCVCSSVLGLESIMAVRACHPSHVIRNLGCVLCRLRPNTNGHKYLQGTRSGIAADPNLCPRRKQSQIRAPRHRHRAANLLPLASHPIVNGAPTSKCQSLLPWSMAVISHKQSCRVPIILLPPTAPARLLQMIAKLEEHRGVASTTPQ
jgi:hypothetical protein